MDDRYDSCHYLLPVIEERPEAFFTNGDDERLQRAWAREKGLPAGASLADILRAQMEEHRADVFYNLDPIRFGGAFVRRLPGCVKRTICWWAAPTAGLDLSGFDVLVCNFPSILNSYRAAGMRVALFSPAHDHELNAYQGQEDRPVDVLFVGGYSRHHKRRAKVLEVVAQLSGRLSIEFYLDRSRLTRLAETPLGLIPPLRSHRRPQCIRRIASSPIFGRSLYEKMSTAKIVLNGAVDMAGEDRGNMRCFEAMGCGALLVSDRGNYPQGFQDGENMVQYDSPNDAGAKILDLLADWEKGVEMSRAGVRMIRETYSKDRQWSRFVEIVSEI